VRLQLGVGDAIFASDGDDLLDRVSLLSGLCSFDLLLQLGLLRQQFGKFALSIGVQTGPTIGVQKGTTWRRCAGVDAGHGFRAGTGVGRA